MNIRGIWIHVFGSMVLGHEINMLDDFGKVIDLLSDL